MKIFSTNEINEIIRYTIEHDGVTLTDLVERAGDGIAREVSARYAPSKHIIVFAGWGTKGAYALSAARKLLAMGYNPEIYLFNIGGNRLSAECANAKKFLLREYGKSRFNEISQSFETPDLDRDTLVLDGMFGSELERPLPKSFGLLIRAINESGAEIVAIEIPSGLFAEWNTNNSISRDIIHASLTLAIEFPLLSFFMNENIRLVGDWRIIEIGLSQEAIKHAKYTYYMVTSGDIKRAMHYRQPDTSKADYGSALICAGSRGMTGAAVLAARGCLRGGAGKVTCYGPRFGCQVLQTAEPCAMYLCDQGENEITKVNLDRNFDSIAIGPGIGTSDATVSAVEAFLKMSFSKRRPLVIDADALNCIARRPLMLNYLPALSVLTPHAGEFDHIFGAQPSAEARLRKALEVSKYHNIIILLKGRYTTIVRPDGKVYFNSSGTPALATPGSGDVLTGVITALIAQHYTAETASIIGAYVHGLAGELAEDVHGSYGVTASDVADNIGKAIKKIME